MVIDLLLKRAAELGVQIRYETGATRLVVQDGAVAGSRGNTSATQEPYARPPW